MTNQIVPQRIQNKIEVLKNASHADSVAAAWLYKGVNTLTGQQRHCAIVKTDTRPYDPGPAEIGSHTDIWIGTERFKKEQELGGQASIGFAGLFEFGASFDTKQSLKTSAYGITVVCYVKKVESSLQLNEFKLKDGLKSPKTPIEIKEFVREYGDSFVKSVTVGGRFMIMYRFHASSEEEQTRLDASLKASGIVKMVGFDAGINGKINEFRKKTNVNINCSFSIIGTSRTEGLNPSDPESIVRYGQRFMETDLERPAVVDWSTEGYEGVLHFGEFKPVSINRESFLKSSGWIDRQISLCNLFEQIKWILRIYKFHSISDTFDTNLVKKITPVIVDINKVKEKFNSYLDNPAVLLPPLESIKLPSLEYDIPRPNYLPTRYSIEYGGKFGGAFNHSLPDRIQRISEIKISYKQFVNLINVKYEFLIYQEESNETREENIGRREGLERGPLLLINADYIKQVDLRSGEYLDFIKFVTRHGTSLKGGGEGGSLVKINISEHENERIVAFQGRSGHLVDQLKFVTIKVKPAL